MRNLFLNRLFCIFIFSSFSLSQIDYTISHELNYGDGKELLNGQYVPYNYFENLVYNPYGQIVHYYNSSYISFKYRSKIV